MADQESTPDRPCFQPRPTADGAAAAYLAWKLSARIRVTQEGCWECAGDGNYANLDLKHWDWPERTVQLHRLVYELCVDSLPEGANVLHRCDNPPCCRPDHLFLGTNADNIADKVEKGRQADGPAVRKNHGHLKGEVVKTSRFTAVQVMEMRRRDAAGEDPAGIRRDFGISDVHLAYVLTGKAWAHLPLLYAGDRKNRPCPKCGAVFPTRRGIFYRHVAACDLVLGKE
jgi:hypothetical protein